ncbi:F-box domain-containing protein [Blastomyces gilchristii SLH14081]|uniref:F-box domain-containing protein n=1 Tax=Blastomyces gilchristii (strain SLH14081) TaxID=559298 RepID=A0A179UHP4_BLAGS|nr:F-box domain-containing protein [Blastomyces gilchristii SLH14081]OAT07566.1 F-box domain-containing protein [Blastomyces gilchristii SLH14081]
MHLLLLFSLADPSSIDIGPSELAALQVVSRRLFNICRDNSIWRQHCYEAANHKLQDRNALFHNRRPNTNSANNPGSVIDALLTGHVQGGSITESSESAHADADGAHDRRTSPPASSASHWDPSYEGEEVDWYSEYIARNAPISIQWLQEPYAAADQDGDDAIIQREVKGMGLLKDYRYGGSDKIIGPLDDGTLCLWDLNRSSLCKRNTRGKIVETSARGALTTDSSRRAHEPFSSRPTNLDFISIGECVSVDSFHQAAYIAVGNILNEVDLSTLQVVSQQKYPWSIFALSQETEYAAPLTVGTTRSLNIYDPRFCGAGSDTRIHYPMPPYNSRFVSLFQPVPLSVLHTPPPNINSIVVAGRFSAILLYDRRNLSSLLSTAHSGARICSLTAIPACPRPYSVTCPELQNNHTIVAAGEYKGRGSLEMFSASTPSTPGDFQTQKRSLLVKDGICLNRQSASGSKLLSVAVHGTRLVFTDANGYIKWVERDGRTEVRRWNLSNDTKHRRRQLDSTHPIPSSSHDLEYYRRTDEYATGDSDIVRKILPTGYSDVLDDELLIWTGDRIGRLRFSSKAGHDWNKEAEIYEEEMAEAARRDEERKRALYAETVFKSFRTHQQELTWMGDFGMGA